MWWFVLIHPQLFQFPCGLCVGSSWQSEIKNAACGCEWGRVKESKQGQNPDTIGFSGFCSKTLSKLIHAAAKALQSCPTLCDPTDGSPPGSPSLGFSRQEHWSGLPFPSPMHEGEKWKWSLSVVSDSQRPYGLQPTGLLRPWDFPGKSTGVGCHCLLRTNP